MDDDNLIELDIGNRTTCCDYEFDVNDHPVFWNRFNKQVQCHVCGTFYGPHIFDEE